MGSLAFGGTGKTPVTEALTKISKSLGLSPIVLPHLYKPLRYQFTSWFAPTVADEAEALAKRFPTETQFSNDRGTLLKKLLQEFHKNHTQDLVICDGGFWDQNLPRSANLLTFDATMSTKHLPFGPLRQSIKSMNRAQIVWLHKVDEPNAHPLPMKPESAIYIESFVKLSGIQLSNGKHESAEILKNQEVNLICGIARPNSVVHTLQKYGARVVASKFLNDHEPIQACHVEALRKKSPHAMLVTTTKDLPRWPKCVELPNILEIELEISGDISQLHAILRGENLR